MGQTWLSITLRKVSLVPVSLEQLQADSSRSNGFRVVLEPRDSEHREELGPSLGPGNIRATCDLWSLG